MLRRKNKKPINTPTPWGVGEVNGLFKDIQLVND